METKQQTWLIGNNCSLRYVTETEGDAQIIK